MSTPIDLYYWPTPNGWKLSIMFEELGETYNVIPINIARGDQFLPEFLRISVGSETQLEQMFTALGEIL